MAKGRKSVALFEVITAQQEKRAAEQIPRPGFWKRVGARRKPKLDIFRKPEKEPETEAQRKERARTEAKLKNAAALKVAQQRTAAREAQKARAQARKAEKENRKTQRAAAQRKQAVERRDARQSDKPEKPEKPERSVAVDKALAVVARLRGVAKISGGKLVVTLDWLTGSFLVAGIGLLFVVAFVAGGLSGEPEPRADAQNASVNPLAGRTEPGAAGLTSTPGAAGRIRPGPPPSQTFRFDSTLQYIVVQTIKSREAAAKSQRFLASRGIRSVIVPITGQRGQRKFEVVCTEGVAGMRSPRRHELSAEIRKIGKLYNAPPYRGGTDFSTLFLKSGIHY